MKVVVLGAGALGSILAGHLARAGEDVTLISRGARAHYLQHHGITITGLVDFTIPCAVVTDPARLSHADVARLTLRGSRSASPRSSITAARPPEKPVPRC